MSYTGVTRGAQVTGVAVCSLCLTWISMSLRLYARLGILKFFGREDWLTIAAMIVFTVFCALCLATLNFGLGAHMYNIEPDSLTMGFKLIFFCELLYVATTAVAKLSIGAYFLRLSSKKYQVRTVYITLAVVMVFSTMYFFFLLFQCAPIDHLWSKYGGGQGKCLHEPILANVTYAHAAMSAVTDWVFGILPIFFVWNMEMNPRTKISVVLILSLGFFASSATIVRIVYIHQLEHTDDYSWEGINLVKWSMVEPAIAITAMNIATLRPMFKNFFVFARKRFDTSIDEESTRPSDDQAYRAARNSVYAKEYSVEFADMLGLSRVGVTTMISAGGSKPEKDHFRKRFTMRTTPKMERKEQNESQTELNLVQSHGVTPGSAPEDEFNWAKAIKSTTVVTIDR